MQYAHILTYSILVCACPRTLGMTKHMTGLTNAVEGDGFRPTFFTPFSSLSLDIAYSSICDQLHFRVIYSTL